MNEQGRLNVWSFSSSSLYFCLTSLWHVITTFSTVLPLEGRNAYQTGLPLVVSPLVCQEGDPTCFPSGGIMRLSRYPEHLTTWQNALTQQTDLSLVRQINPPGWSWGSGAWLSCSCVWLKAKPRLPTLGWQRQRALPMHQACQGRLAGR